MKSKLARPDDNMGVNSEKPLGFFDQSHGTTAAIDWITATTKDEEVSEHWRGLFAEYWQDFYAEVGAPQRFTAYGYTGGELPGFKWATHPTHGAMVIVSGHGANVAWRDVLSRVERSNITRIDLAVTRNLKFRMTEVAAIEYASLIADKIQPHIAKKLITNNQGGETLYIGSRTSQIFCRLYDKSAEQGDKPGWSWRYEIEYKKPVSNQIAQMIMSLAGGDESAVWESIVSTVWEAFDDRGVTPIFDPQGEFVMPTRAKREKSPISNRLKWLATSVAPAVRELIAAGYGDAVYELLGITLDKKR